MTLDEIKGLTAAIDELLDKLFWELTYREHPFEFQSPSMRVAHAQEEINRAVQDMVQKGE